MRWVIEMSALHKGALNGARVQLVTQVLSSQAGSLLTLSKR
jgi:hypothetical protein